MASILEIPYVQRSWHFLFELDKLFGESHFNHPIPWIFDKDRIGINNKLPVAKQVELLARDMTNFASVEIDSIEVEVLNEIEFPSQSSMIESMFAENAESFAEFMRNKHQYRTERREHLSSARNIRLQIAFAGYAMEAEVIHQTSLEVAMAFLAANRPETVFWTPEEEGWVVVVLAQMLGFGVYGCNSWKLSRYKPKIERVELEKPHIEPATLELFAFMQAWITQGYCQKFSKFKKYLDPDARLYVKKALKELEKIEKAKLKAKK